MSTDIKTIIGRYQSTEKPCHNFKPIYKEANLHLTRFYGGENNGRMLQLTIASDETAYIQLTKEQVKELSIILSQCFDDSIYPSE